jgi:hypothetical protein
MDPWQAPSAEIALTTAGSLVWSNKTRHIKKQRDRGGIGLRWPPFGKKKQQSTIVGRNNGRYYGE